MQSTASLRNVETGMRVFDRNHHEIGKVEWVQFGDDDPDTPELELAGGTVYPESETLLDMIAKAFRPDDLPEELKERLLHEGFVRIDADGLFAADRYVTPAQIDSVSDDELTLKVTRDELIKRM